METLVSAAFQNFYANRRVLLTGHTGFKGSWLGLWLKQLGAEVHGFSLPAPTKPSLHEVLPAGTFAGEFIEDIRNPQALLQVVKNVRPEVVFHLAAQSLVRHSYTDPVGTFTTNVIGTMNLLEALRATRTACALVVVTSDKCYAHPGTDHGCAEDDPLGGSDVYSMSKAATELLVYAWRSSFFQKDLALGPVATVRGGNVIGGGDYAQDRIVPDCLRALTEHRPIDVRNPDATRPWQHVLDCLSGYLWLGSKLGGSSRGGGLDGAYNIGPVLSSVHPVSALVEEFLKHWPGEWRTDSDPHAPRETPRLHLNAHKAAEQLNWVPTYDFPEAVRETALWYRARHLDHLRELGPFSVNQIESFTRAAADRGVAWACTNSK